MAKFRVIGMAEYTVVIDADNEQAARKKFDQRDFSEVTIKPITIASPLVLSTTPSLIEAIEDEHYSG